MGSEYNLWTKSCPLASAKIEKREKGKECKGSGNVLISRSLLFTFICNPMSVDCLQF